MEYVKLEHSLQKIKKRIFYISIVTALFGFILDTCKFYDASSTLFYNNVISFTLTLIAFSLFLLKRINLRLAFGTLSYIVVFNILVGCIIDPFSIFRINFFLRDSLFIVFMITISALTVGKIHSIIISSLYFIGSIVFVFITKNQFLNSSLYLIVIFIFAYAFLINYIINMLEKAIRRLQNNNFEIQQKNETVKMNNELLLQRQKEIELQAEEITKQRDKLREANASKDKLFSIIAHDLKSPFNSMIGFSDLLLSDLRNYPLDVIEKHIIYISNSAKNTFNLIENLLHWSRSQRGMITYKPVPLKISEAINSELKVLNRQATLKKINIEMHLSGKEIATKVDPALFQIIVRNLVSNAIKYSFINSTIDVNLEFNQNEFSVAVQDYGVGISEEVKDSLFTLYERTLPGTDGESGTGLGLVLCKEFVEMHGGKISFESEQNKGSRFEFRIPVCHMQDT